MSSATSNQEIDETKLLQGVVSKVTSVLKESKQGDKIEYDEVNTLDVKKCNMQVAQRGEMSLNCGRLNPNVCCASQNEKCIQNKLNPKYKKNATRCARIKEVEVSAEEVSEIINNYDIKNATFAKSSKDIQGNGAYLYEQSCANNEYCEKDSLCVVYEGSKNVCIPQKNKLTEGSIKEYTREIFSNLIDEEKVEYDEINTLDPKAPNKVVEGRGKMTVSCKPYHPTAQCAENEKCIQNKLNSNYKKNATRCAKRVEVRYSNEEVQEALDAFDFKHAHVAYDESNVTKEVKEMIKEIGVENFESNCGTLDNFCEKNSICVNYKDGQDVCVPMVANYNEESTKKNGILMSIRKNSSDKNGVVTGLLGNLTAELKKEKDSNTKNDGDDGLSEAEPCKFTSDARSLTMIPVVGACKMCNLNYNDVKVCDLVRGERVGIGTYRYKLYYCSASQDCKKVENIWYCTGSEDEDNEGEIKCGEGKELKSVDIEGKQVRKCCNKEMRLMENDMQNSEPICCGYNEVVQDGKCTNVEKAGICTSPRYYAIAVAGGFKCCPFGYRFFYGGGCYMCPKGQVLDFRTGRCEDDPDDDQLYGECEDEDGNKGSLCYITEVENTYPNSIANTIGHKYMKMCCRKGYKCMEKTIQGKTVKGCFIDESKKFKKEECNSETETFCTRDPSIEYGFCCDKETEICTKNDGIFLNDPRDAFCERKTDCDDPDLEQVVTKSGKVVCCPSEMKYYYNGMCQYCDINEQLVIYNFESGNVPLPPIRDKDIGLTVNQENTWSCVPKGYDCDDQYIRCSNENTIDKSGDDMVSLTKDLSALPQELREMFVCCNPDTHFCGVDLQGRPLCKPRSDIATSPTPASPSTTSSSSSSSSSSRSAEDEFWSALGAALSGNSASAQSGM